MAKTYTIQKGDTLGAIAKKYGVGVGDISGYKSGNADLIYPGENINIGEKAKAPEPTSYVNEVKSQLTSEDTKPEGDYGLGKVKTDMETTKKSRDDAFNSLKDLSTTTFNTEYDNRKLADKKAKIATIDNELALARQERDDAISKVRSNPGLSAAQMTGDIKKIADYQNAVINNKIAERNSVATEYNNDLSEVDKIVSNKLKDKELEYNYYDKALKGLTDSASEYTKAYREDLQNESEMDYKDRALAQALEIARMNAEAKGGKDLKLQTDKEGNPLYWYDNEGNITPVEGAETENNSGYDALEASTAETPTTSGASWYKPWTWF